MQGVDGNHLVQVVRDSAQPAKRRQRRHEGVDAALGLQHDAALARPRRAAELGRHQVPRQRLDDVARRRCDAFLRASVLGLHLARRAGLACVARLHAQHRPLLGPVTCVQEHPQKGEGVAADTRVQVVAIMARGDGVAEGEVEGSLQDAPAAPRRFFFASGLLERPHNGHVGNGEPAHVPRDVIDHADADGIQIVGWGGDGRYKRKARSRGFMPLEGSQAHGGRPARVQGTETVEEYERNARTARPGEQTCITVDVKA